MVGRARCVERCGAAHHHCELWLHAPGGGNLLSRSRDRALSSTTRTGRCERLQARADSTAELLGKTEAQRDVKGASLIWDAFDPYASVHQLGQARRNRESESRAAIASGHTTVSLRERLENSALFVRGNADPCVAHVQVQYRRCLWVRCQRHRHLDLTLLGELDGVAHEVEHDLP